MPKNVRRSAEQAFTIAVDDVLALTPPMGHGAAMLRFWPARK
jgi:hypothetical protein